MTKSQPANGGRTRQRIISRAQKIGLNPFLVLLLLMVLLAFLFPEYGIDKSVIPFGAIIKYGMPVIFFLYGVKLSPDELRAGLTNWRLHLLVQSTTFILFPIIVLAFGFLRDNESFGVLWLGIFYLAALPSTVSSSVVMVSIAKGNVPAAIFNASLSSIIGIFITPMWMGFFIQNTASASEFTSVIWTLCLQVLFPVIVGFMLHQPLQFLMRYKKQLQFLDQFVILAIVYTAFSESFYEHSFEAYSIGKVIALAVLMLLFFLAVFALMYAISSALKFSREDRITVLFCGSKKSLVQGALMGGVLFTGATTLGVILLPLMLYHGLQLMAGSALATRMGTKKEELKAESRKLKAESSTRDPKKVNGYVADGYPAYLWIYSCICICLRFSHQP